MKRILLLMVGVCILYSTYAQTNFEKYKLDNGLTVVLDQDLSMRNVFGVVAINAGSIDEKPDATGMAHYLEHMLFKGTRTMGTSNWEKEKVQLEKIKVLYDDLQSKNSKEEIDEVYEKIDEASQEAAQYAIPNEFSKMIQQMGGIGLNASTNFDVTQYYNIFPANQLEKWVDLYAHRLQDPVFRLFQTELEAVYEEKNISEDNPYFEYLNTVRRNTFKGTAYERSIIGKTEHLKKPSISKMQAFFDTWYVPNNMILVLSGNFNFEDAKKFIKNKFGVLKSKSLPKRNHGQLEPVKGKKKLSVKLTPLVIGQIVYQIQTSSNKEAVSLDLAAQVLSNSFRTGLLDKLVIDGDLLSADAFHDELKSTGSFGIFYIPIFDINQRRQMSVSAAEKIVINELDKIRKGDFPDWLLKQVKENLIQTHNLAIENTSLRASILVDLFVKGKDLDDFFKYKESVSSVTKEDIKNVANKFLKDNYIAIYSDRGNPKSKKLEKPKFTPIKVKATSPSQYYNEFVKIPSADAEYDFIDLEKDVTIKLFQDKINLYHINNKKNDVFTLSIVFHAGTKKFPKIGYATELMNNAGVLGQYKSDELRAAIAKLGVTYNFSASESSTTIYLRGSEEKLAEACKLLSKLMLLPSIEEKSLNNIIGQELQNRSIEKTSVSSLRNAFREYIYYGKKSRYINRISSSDIISFSPSDLTTVFNKASGYNAEIFYAGKKSPNEIHSILKKNLAFAADRLVGKPLSRRELMKYDKNTVFLLQNSKSKQNQIFLYIQGLPSTLEENPTIEAFNQYFSGSFNGLMVKEIRELRALAYSAGANYSISRFPDFKNRFVCFVGTQSDKTAEATEVLVNLVTDMPNYPDRLPAIKSYLKNSTFLRPNIRSIPQIIYSAKLMGYKEDPRKFDLPYFNKITYDNIRGFYEKNIKGKPYALGIIGDTKTIKSHASKYGKVTKLSPKKLFSTDL